MNLLLDLFQAYYDARRNKRNTVNQLRFEIDYEHNLFELHDELLAGNYTPRKSICFIVEQPVKREIFAADFRDRIIHHLLFNYLNPLFERQFIYDSYSCRKGRGTMFGIRRAAGFMRKCSENYTRDCYVLKLDIKGYFMSINRTLLWEKIRATALLYSAMLKIPVERDLFFSWIETVLFNDPKKQCIVKGLPSDWEGLPPSKSLFYAAPDCGLPIGNLTSQLFSNVYLHEFDCFVKQELGIEYYGRYVDDFVLIHSDKEYLKSCLKQIKTVLKERFLLELHPDKIFMQHYAKGFAFLGVYIKPCCIYAGKRLRRRFRQSMTEIEQLLSNGLPVTKKDLVLIRSRVNSYLGILKHYNTYNLRRKVLFNRKKYYQLFRYGYMIILPYKAMKFYLN
jgi:retron-type reverse transcriptase